MQKHRELEKVAATNGLQVDDCFGVFPTERRTSIAQDT